MRTESLAKVSLSIKITQFHFDSTLRILPTQLQKEALSADQQTKYQARAHDTPSLKTGGSILSSKYKTAQYTLSYNQFKIKAESTWI